MKALILAAAATLAVWWWWQPYSVQVPGSDASFEYIVRHSNNADDDAELPMIVALHGNGDSPANFFDTVLDGLDESARIVLLKGPRVMGFGGAAWPTRGDELPDCGDHVAAAVRVLARRFPTAGAPIVVGFSGGAIVAYYLAAAHPERFSTVVPVAGLLPEAAIESIGVTPPSDVVVHAFHGTGDQLVGIDGGRRATERLRTMRIDATLTELDGDHHAIFLRGKPVVLDRLAESVRAASASPRNR